MKSKNYIGICVSLIFIIIMFILRFWTDIDSSFYILFFFPSIIVFPYSDKTFIYRINKQLCACYYFLSFGGIIVYKI